MTKAEDKRFTQQDVDLKVMANQVNGIDLAVKEIKAKLEAGYVTKDELKVVQQQLDLISRIVYGVIGLILTIVVGGAISFFVNSPK